MGIGHAGAALGILALVASTALMAWLGTKENVCKCTKALAWVALVASILLLIGQAITCYQCNIGGKCARPMMGGMGMMHGMGGMPPAMPPPDEPKEKK